LCVYVDGKVVVDVFGTSSEEGVYNADSLTTVWSTGKMLGAILIATLVDQGLLSYDDKVSKYWPEFA